MADPGRLAGGDPAADPARGRGPARPDRRHRSRDYQPGTSCAVPLLWNLATYLPSAIPLWAGTEVHLGDTLLRPWLADTYQATGSREITYYSNTDDKWYLYLVWRLLEQEPRRGSRRSS